MQHRTWRTLVVTATLISALSSLRAFGGPVPADLLRLVGRDVGLCIEITQGRERRLAFAQSELWARVRQCPFFQEWRKSPEYQKLTEARRLFERSANQSAEEFIDTLFGRQIVLAVYPADEGKPVGVLITRATNAAALEQAVSLWNRVDPQPLTKQEYRGVSLMTRTRPSQGRRPAETVHYLVYEDVLALSDNLAPLRQIIDLAAPASAAAAPVATLVDNEGYQQARRSLTDNPAASVYLRPRAWDMALKIDAALSGNDHGARAAAAAWSRCDSVIAAAYLEDGVVFEAIAHYPTSATSSDWREFVSQTAGRGTFLQRVPANAILAGIAREDFTLWGRLLSCAVPAGANRDWDRTRQVVKGLLEGHDLLDDVFPMLGPTIGGYIAPRKPQGTNELPVTALATVEFRGGETGVPNSLRRGLDNALSTGLNLLAAWRNSQIPDTVASVRSEDFEAATTLGRSLRGLPLVEPAYAVANTELVVGTTPDAVRGFLTAKPSSQAALAQTEFEPLMRRWMESENQVLLFNARELRNVVAQDRSWFESLLGKTPEQNAKRLGRIEAGLKLFDFAFLAGSVGNDRTRIVGGVTTATK
jgi:hypothetical protein